MKDRVLKGRSEDKVYSVRGIRSPTLFFIKFTILYFIIFCSLLIVELSEM